MKHLVTIVIPSHERPDYLSLALRSVQEQTYENLQIIITDNSVKHDCREALGTQISGDPRVLFVRQEGGGFMDNWRNGLKHATGEYMNMLMDDDLFHPRKVEQMVRYLDNYPSVGLVTSFRQLIDDAGRPLAPLPGTQRLYETDTVLEGRSFGDFILKSGMNLIGEPTTAMFRRADIPGGFGHFCGEQYYVLSDLATWLHVMQGRHCVYIAEALSSFRLHGGQDQRRKGTALNAQLEWLQLLLDGHGHGAYFVDDAAFREQLAGKLPGLMQYLVEQRDEIRQGSYDVARMQRLLAQGFGALVQ